MSHLRLVLRKLTGLAHTSTSRPLHHSWYLHFCLYQLSSTSTPLQLMETLSQLDVQNPDHISVITRDGKVTVSVIKDGTSVTLGFPIKNTMFDTTPRPPLQRPAPQVKAVIGTKEITEAKPKRSPRSWTPTSKLNPESVKEIRLFIADKDLRRVCGTITNFYNVIGRKYGVTGCSISNIARGIAWKHVK